MQCWIFQCAAVRCTNVFDCQRCAPSDIRFLVACNLPNGKCLKQNIFG